MFLDKRAAAWVTAYLMADGPVHEVAKRIDPESALFVVKCVTTFGSYALGEHAPAIKEILEAVHESQALEPSLFQAEVALGMFEAEQAQPEQVEAEQVKAEQAKTELDKAAEQVKVEMIKADAERAAAVIEEQTAIVEQEIVDEPGKVAGEIDVLEKEFEREKQRRETMLDEMERNYFKKHPDLSKDEREEAEKTFEGIKDKEMENLSRERETRLGELTHAQEQHREELAERLEELEDTRERS